MTRHRTTALGTGRIHEGWRDHTTSARREHIFGRIVPMERPEGECTHRAGVGLLLLIGVVFGLVWVVMP